MVATTLMRGRGACGEAEWRRWLHRGTEQRRERAVAEKEEVQGVKEAKFLEGEGKKSLGLVALRSEEAEEEAVVIYMLASQDKDGWRKD